VTSNCIELHFQNILTKLEQIKWNKCNRNIMPR